MGGPVWHASGRSKTRRAGEKIALRALRNVGDMDMETRIFDGHDGIVHAQRRLSAKECADYSIGPLCDVRGSDEERARIATALSELPLATRILLAKGPR